MKSGCHFNMSQTVQFRQENRQQWDRITDNLNRQVFAAKKEVKGDFEVEIRPLKKKPSQNQRAYYFGVVLPVIRLAAANQEMHYKSVEALDQDIREIMKDEYSLYSEVKNNITGKTEIRSISLSNIKGNKDMVRKYIDSVILWAESFFLIQIPSYRS